LDEQRRLHGAEAALPSEHRELRGNSIPLAYAVTVVIDPTGLREE
jgi:hypothetical protein